MKKHFYLEKVYLNLFSHLKRQFVMNGLSK